MLRKLTIMMILFSMISVVVFGMSMEMGGSFNFMFLTTPAMLPPCNPNEPVFPANIITAGDSTLSVPVSNNFALTTDFELCISPRSFLMCGTSVFFISSIGVRYTSDTIEHTFIGPFKMFAGINGGSLFWTGGKIFPVLSVDGGISFKFINNIYTYWEVEAYDSFSDMVSYSNPMIIGGAGLTF